MRCKRPARVQTDMCEVRKICVGLEQRVRAIRTISAGLEQEMHSVIMMNAANEENVQAVRYRRNTRARQAQGEHDEREHEEKVHQEHAINLACEQDTQVVRTLSARLD